MIDWDIICHPRWGTWTIDESGRCECGCDFGDGRTVRLDVCNDELEVRNDGLEEGALMKGRWEACCEDGAIEGHQGKGR